MRGNNKSKANPFIYSYGLNLAPSPTSDILASLSIHLHLPSGSVRKDGPSAGIALVCAVVSLLSGKTLDPR
jgi:ATP-dependent Lon protease